MCRRARNAKPSWGLGGEIQDDMHPGPNGNIFNMKRLWGCTGAREGREFGEKAIFS